MLKRLCIIGVGLIGGSFARALRESGLVQEVVGVDSDPNNLHEAKALGIIDHGFSRIDEGVCGADCVFISVPVGSMTEIFRQLAPVWQNAAVYTDAGSTKRDVLASLESVFGAVPPNYVPGHPIAGAEKSGAAAARSDLYKGRRVILTPTRDTYPRALDQVRDLWEATGGKVSVMSAAHHDQVLAATSHLPHLLSFALTAMLGRHDEEQEIFTYAAGGLRDFTRIAGSDPIMWRDISLANRDQLLLLISEYRDAIDRIARMLTDEDSAGLENLFVDANLARQRFIDQLDK